MITRDHPRRLRLVIGLVLGLVTFALYLPVLRHGFVQYDDQQYVTENPHVQAGLTWKGLRWAFGFHAGNWHPLTWLSHMLDCGIYGTWAGGHHLTNVLLHAASTVLLFLALERMTGKPWRSAAVAALFAWHPLHVESVAWIAERKDVLCGFFWMLTLFSYVCYTAKPAIGKYLLTLLFFALCLMAKPMGVTLPFVLLLLDYWMKTAQINARPWRNLVGEKAPFVLLAAGDCVLTMLAQREAIVSTKGLAVFGRIGHTALAYFHYLAAAFVPVHLAVYYPYETNVPGAMIALACVVLALITVLALKYARQQPWLIVGWLWYLGTLVPVIGLVQVGDQAWADRYTYLPLIGIFIAVIWGITEIIRPRMALVVLGAVTAAALVATASVQLSYWRDTRTLFTHTYRVTHENYMALTVLGSELAREGKLDEAIADYHLALQYKPTFPETHFFLGNALEKQGKDDLAAAEYQQALWFKPISEQTHIFLGMLLGKQKKYDEAAAHYRAALKVNPDSPVAHNNLARILHSQGRLDEAIEHYQAALELNPKLALAHNNLGILLLQKNQTAEGTAHLREALRLKPGDAETEYNLALALNQQGKWSEAAGLFEKTVSGGLADPKAHYEYATALAHLQKTREAMGQYASALLLRADFPDALAGLSWILSTSPNPAYRNGTEALKMALQACKPTQDKDADKLKTLAAAYAETGQFANAIKAAQAAQALAQTANRADLARECGRMLEQFQQSKPWRSDDLP